MYSILKGGKRVDFAVTKEVLIQSTQAFVFPQDFGHNRKSAILPPLAPSYTSKKRLS
jgi:hypothetical protein